MAPDAPLIQRAPPAAVHIGPATQRPTLLPPGLTAQVLVTLRPGGRVDLEISTPGQTPDYALAKKLLEAALYGLRESRQRAAGSIIVKGL